MKIRLSIAAGALAIVATIAVLGLPTYAPAFQSQEGMDRGRGHDNDVGYENSPLYQQGLRQGQEDGDNRRVRQYRLRTQNNAARRAYQAGYDQGYQNSRSGRSYPNQSHGAYGRDNNPNGQNNQYGQYGRGNNLAAQMGSQDGINDGRTDQRTGHTNRPTKGDNYKSASRGYSSMLGSKDQYKALYRQSYLPAYQQGYTGSSNGQR